MATKEEDGVHIPVKTKLFVYVSHCFTTLGARMWWFGIGLFLVEVTPHSLQLTALYGFSNGGAMLLLAAVIGDWIDRTARLYAARVALVMNNVSIAICCVVIFFILKYRPEIEAVWEDSRLLTLCFAIVVIITIFSNLCNLGRVIIMERDWIVEICNGDKSTIATMSATLRFIDLCTKVVAPLVTGQVMTYASHIYGAIFIGAWNLFAVVIEYYLVWKVYSLVPSLHTKESEDNSEIKPKEILAKNPGSKPYNIVPTEDQDTNNTNSHQVKMHEEPSSYSDKNPDALGSHEELNSTQTGNETDATEDKDLEKNPSTSDTKESLPQEKEKDGEHPKSFSEQLCHSFMSLHRGWKTYMKYDVAIAGWSLAFLYFTVLGFDNITIGYATTQGMTESIVGILIGCAALFGIIASISYPFIRRRVGLVRTGTIALSWEVSCLCLCIISLWMPGGTFDPNRDWPKNDVINGNCSNIVTSTSRTMNLENSMKTGNMSNIIQEPEFEASMSLCNRTMLEADDIPESKASVVMLMTGIVGARFGVWLVDLTITQLFLEAVVEKERGIVNGFQSALNKFMDMLKFIMIIFIPDPSMFGYPAIVSFCFIFAAWLLYSRFSKKITGHMFCGAHTELEAKP